MPSWLRKTVAYVVAVLLLGVLLWLVANVVMAVRTVTFALVGAILLTGLLSWIYRALRWCRFPTWLASLGAIGLLLAFVAGALFLVVNRALSQVGSLQSALTDAVSRLKDTLVQSPLQLNQERLDQAENQLVSYVRDWLPSPSAGANLLLQLLIGLVLVIFLIFFFLKDGRDMWLWLLSWTPRSRRTEVDRAGKAAWDVLTNYVRGTVVVALIDAVGIGAAMFVMGVPLAASLTLIVFIGAFVPIVGATVSGALAVGVTLVLLGPVQALVLLGVVLLVQQVEGNVLQPLVMGRALHLHPVVIVLAVTAATTLAGILGAIAAVPVVAVGYRVVDELSDRGSPSRPPPQR